MHRGFGYAQTRPPITPALSSKATPVTAGRSPPTQPLISTAPTTHSISPAHTQARACQSSSLAKTTVSRLTIGAWPRG
ncbi:MAG: hypothetical protein KC475_00685 [Cyanobacteria bacterium HKST-UBA03]|nr:hypothetical protein [Cyanobacteria bacterium HKST-UBA03]